VFTLAAWSQTVDPAGAFVALNAVVDQHLVVLTVSGIEVPSLNQVIALAAGVETTVAQQARLTAPSRRILALQRIAPTQGNAAGPSLPADPQHVVDLLDVPIPMVVGETAQIEILSDPAAAQVQWGLVWFADGPVAELKVPTFTIRATGATVLAANAWVLVPLVFSETLPRGRYQLVGLRAQSANMVAARAVFPGGPWRPGVLGTNTDRHLENRMFRWGNMGVFGEFEDTAPPQVECLAAAADAAEVFYLDLIQIRSGPGGG